MLNVEEGQYFMNFYFYDSEQALKSVSLNQIKELIETLENNKRECCIDENISEVKEAIEALKQL